MKYGYVLVIMTITITTVSVCFVQMDAVEEEPCISDVSNSSEQLYIDTLPTPYISKSKSMKEIEQEMP
jgi:hypothetical protein